MNAPRSISERALQALRWNYLGTAGRIAAQFVSQIILARLLGPEPTGMFAYAFLVVALCALFLEMGLGAGLVQSRQLSDQQIGTACGRLLFMGCVSSLTIYAFADVIADVVFSTPEAGKLIRAMAPALLISAAAFPASALLRRDLEFRIIQVAELASYVFGYLIVGVTAAYFGMGVWSLVFAWYAQSASNCLAMYVFAPRPPILGNPLRSLSITRFGVVFMMTNLLNWAIENGTHVAVGRFFGPTALGQFTLSNNLVRTPANHLVVNLQSVLFPMAARAQDNDAGLRRAYLTALAGVGLIAFPTFAFVAIMAKPIVLLLLGPKWADAALVLTPLAAAMIPHAAMALCGPVLNGRGQPEVELRLQALTLAADARRARGDVAVVTCRNGVGIGARVPVSLHLDDIGTHAAVADLAAWSRASSAGTDPDGQFGGGCRIRCRTCPACDRRGSPGEFGPRDCSCMHDRDRCADRHHGTVARSRAADALDGRQVPDIPSICSVASRAAAHRPPRPSGCRLIAFERRLHSNEDRNRRTHCNGERRASPWCQRSRGAARVHRCADSGDSHREHARSRARRRWHHDRCRP